MKHGLFDYLEVLQKSGLSDWGPFTISEEEVENVNRFFTEFADFAASQIPEEETEFAEQPTVGEQPTIIEQPVVEQPIVAEPPPVPSVSSDTMNAKKSSTSKSASKGPVDRASALALLAEEVKKCQKCEILAKSRTQTVFGAGNPNADLVFIGEAPGADEDREGIPFVGRSGQLLTDMITKGMKIAREDVYICNILRCRPPGNRTPTSEEATNCRPFLEQTLEIIQPKFICCLGTVAAQNLLQTSTAIGLLRGKKLEYKEIPVVCTYHPSYLLRTPSAKKSAWEDLQVLMQLMGLPIPEKSI